MDAIALGSTSGFSGPDRAQPTQPVEATRSESSSSDTSDASAAALTSAGLPNFTTLKQAEQAGDQIAISDEQVLKAIERALKNLAGKTTSLQFSIHEKTKQVMVKVVDSENGDIIREIPPEKNLDFLATLWKQAGILVDERR